MSELDDFPYRVARPGVLDIQPYQPGKPVEELERELGIANAIKLASNENPLGASPLALAAMHEDSEAISRYPDGSGFRLGMALAARLDVSPEQLTLGNGSNDVLDMVARAFAGPGDEVVFSEYAFLVYPLVTFAAGARAVVVPAHGWGHDLGAMADAINVRTKVVFIANPNNPTGSYVSLDALTEFLSKVPAHVVVVVDEAYLEYADDVSDYPDGLTLLAKHPNLIVTRTFSKVYGLAGLRVGYAVASATISDLLNRVRQPFNTSAVAQHVAVAALEDQEHVQRSHDSNLQQRRRLETVCEELQLEYIPSVANFLSVRFGPHAGDIYHSLLQEGIIVRPVANYRLPEHLRITIGRAQEMDRLIAQLRKLVRGD